MAPQSVKNRTLVILTQFLGTIKSLNPMCGEKEKKQLANAEVARMEREFFNDSEMNNVGKRELETNPP